jgi:hypothetical protein
MQLFQFVNTLKGLFGIIYSKKFARNSTINAELILEYRWSLVGLWVIVYD